MPETGMYVTDVRSFRAADGSLLLQFSATKQLIILIPVRTGVQVKKQYMEKLNGPEDSRKYEEEVLEKLRGTIAGNESVQSRWIKIKAATLDAAVERISERKQNSVQSTWFDEECQKMMDERNWV